MLAERISDGIQGQESFGGLNITVQRNAFGSQLDSFEASVPFLNDYVSAAFIRAPIVSQVSEETEIISKLPTGEIVGVREGNIMGISFHPELVGELAVHSLFVEMCKKADFRAEL
jgi:5'-phosphate synthase pdxT subunit